MVITKTGNVKKAEYRQLAAVMFADIEGYSAMFQHDEQAAMKQVGDHRLDLETTTGEYHGRIIQFYGDGSVTMFDSILDAIECAIAIQHKSTLHHIPVRIGIHVGDLIFRNDDIFGDTVNIASRIQAIGVPGAVLVSKKVADELKNQPGYPVVRLGSFSLKNIREPVEIYALTGNGLIVPDPIPLKKAKKNRLPALLLGILAVGLLAGIFYFSGGFRSAASALEHEQILILPFTNLTGDSTLHELSDLPPHYLSNSLIEKSNANVINYASALFYTKGNLASLKGDHKKARRLGATVLLDGHFTYAGSRNDSLVFMANLIDTRTGLYWPVSIPKVYCNSAHRMDCIQALSEQLCGYWKSKDDVVFRHSTIDAYTEFIKAQKAWADPAKASEALAHLSAAIRLDPQYVDAYFLLFDALNNNNAFSEEADTIEYFRKVIQDMSPREENYMHYYEADLHGQNLAAFGYFFKEYQNNRQDLFRNTTGMVLAVEYLNDPLTALRIFNEIDPDSLDLYSCSYCLTRINMALQAYMDLSDLGRAGELAERLRPHASRPAHFIRLIRYYLQIRDTATVSDLILEGAEAYQKRNSEKPYLMTAARLAQVQGLPDMARHYAQRAIRLYGDDRDWIIARCHSLLGNLKSAREIYLSELEQEPDDLRCLGDLGVIYAREGNSKAAEDIILRIGNLTRDFDYGETSYVQGRIMAHLGDHAGAIRQLRKAMDGGIKFQAVTTFLQDPDMIVLNRNPEYLAMLGSLRRTWEQPR